MTNALLNFGNGLHPVVDIEFPEYLVQVVFDSVRTDAQDTADFGICFALSYPGHYFDLSLAQHMDIELRRIADEDGIAVAGRVAQQQAAGTQHPRELAQRSLSPWRSNSGASARREGRQECCGKGVTRRKAVSR